MKSSGMLSPGLRRESKVMFFIMGIQSGQKELSFNQLVICSVCGSYGRYQVLMTYTSLSLFFIPILKWGRRYYVTLPCCKTVYELAPEMGKRIARGEPVEITMADLTLVKAGRREHMEYPADPVTGRKRVCEACGYETGEDFSYCPKCGSELKF